MPGNVTVWRLVGFDGMRDEDAAVAAVQPLAEAALAMGAGVANAIAGDVQLTVETDDPAVLEIIEYVARREGVQLERVADA